MNQIKALFKKHPVYSSVVVVSMLLIASSLVPKKAYTKKYSINTQEGIVESKLNRAVSSVNFYDPRGADLPKIYSAEFTTDAQGFQHGLIEANFYSPQFTHSRGVSALVLTGIFKSLGEISFGATEQKIEFLVKVWDDLVDIRGHEGADIVVTAKLSVEQIKATNWDNMTEDRFFKMISAYGSLWIHPAIKKYNQPE